MGAIVELVGKVKEAKSTKEANNGKK